MGFVADLIPVLQDVSRMFFRRLQIDDLDLDMTWGGTDPADTAIRYGRCWAALESSLSLLENCTTIRNRHVSVRWNYQLEKPVIYGRVAFSLTVAQLIAIGVVAGVRGGKAFLVHRKKLFKPKKDPVRSESGETESKGDLNHGKEPSCE